MRLPARLDRTRPALRSIGGRWRRLRGAERLPAPRDARLSAGDLDRLREHVRRCLEGHGGEVAARGRAVELGLHYQQLGDEGRRQFLSLLAEEFDIDHDAVRDAARELLAARAEPETRVAERALRATLTAPRMTLLAQFNALPDGTAFLVDLREDVLRLAAGDAGLGRLDRDLRSLLSAWFDIGFLELRRVTWDSPASLLEKLAEYEAVHEMRGWDDLKHRLDGDRRMFAFFHPRMPNEPLIFVQVALVRGLAGAIAPLLDAAAEPIDPPDADTAIFYSISNAQKGLAGIGFGNFLIKRVVDELRRELPGLKTFSTLSPIPGFGSWLAGQPDAPVLGDGEPPEELRAVLLRLCARYLLHAKRDGGTALDSVAHFHLTNGARVERINWLGDRSERGLRQSAGLMVNYLYPLTDVEANHEAYVGEGRVPASADVQKLAAA